jgi:hypothetical protein
MFTQRLCRSPGLAAHLGWARLLVDRYRDLVEVPAPTRENFFGVSDPVGGRHRFAKKNKRVLTENKTTQNRPKQHKAPPDDEDAFEYENYHSPDHTY